MAQYLILKLEGEDPCDAAITAHVISDGDAVDAMPQGFAGPGRYVALNWDDRLEGDLVHGPVQVVGVEDRPTREMAAERREEEEA